MFLHLCTFCHYTHRINEGILTESIEIERKIIEGDVGAELNKGYNRRIYLNVYDADVLLQDSVHLR